MLEVRGKASLISSFVTIVIEPGIATIGINIAWTCLWIVCYLSIDYLLQSQQSSDNVFTAK